MTAPQRRVSLSLAAALCVIFFLLYLASFKLNNWLFNDQVYVQGVSWVFLPAGIKLLAVLVARWWGVLGVALAGLWMTHSDVWTDGHWLEHLGNIVVWLVVPFLSIQVLLNWWRLRPDLSNLTFHRLFAINALFTAISAVGTSAYAWFVYERHDADFVATSIAMAFGDFVGTLLVMTAVLAVVIGLERMHTAGRH